MVMGMARGLGDGLLRLCNGAWRDNDGDAVDIVEVVRCKDCVHSFWDEENEMWKCVESAEYDSDFDDYIGFIEYHNEDFFCAYGERRTDVN